MLELLRVLPADGGCRGLAVRSEDRIERGVVAMGQRRQRANRWDVVGAVRQRQQVDQALPQPRLHVQAGIARDLLVGNAPAGQQDRPAAAVGLLVHRPTDAAHQVCHQVAMLLRHRLVPHALREIAGESPEIELDAVDVVAPAHLAHRLHGQVANRVDLEVPRRPQGADLRIAVPAALLARGQRPLGVQPADVVQDRVVERVVAVVHAVGVEDLHAVLPAGVDHHLQGVSALGQQAAVVGGGGDVGIRAAVQPAERAARVVQPHAVGRVVPDRVDLGAPERRGALGEQRLGGTAVLVRAHRVQVVAVVVEDQPAAALRERFSLTHRRPAARRAGV